MKKTAYYQLEDGTFQAFDMFEIDIAEAMAVEPDRWSLEKPQRGAVVEDKRPVALREPTQEEMGDGPPVMPMTTDEVKGRIQRRRRV